MSARFYTYDNISNPLNDGTWMYTWEKGRQLKCMSKAGTTASFKYNENGLRIQKTVNGVVTNYTLHGKNIVHMTQGSNSMHFFYDASNKPAIVEFNGTKYAYVNNLQGDIVAILDSNGNKVVEYKYDAWGKPFTPTGSMATSLGELNPFRYRGYVYDGETGLYYLKSRFYSSISSRFINIDTILGQQKLLEHNIYDYCKNNPVSYSDPSGHETQWDIYEVYVRQPYTPMYDKDRNLIEMVTYETGPIYTKQKGTYVGGRIAVYYFDDEGNEHTGYMLDKDVVVWYGSSPEMMNQYYLRYFGDFFENQNEDINFLRRNNSFYKKNAALNVMLKRFLDSRDSQDSTSLWVNNEYSYATAWAVREFQEHVGISIDGIAGKETLDKLWEYNVSIYRQFVPE